MAEKVLKARLKLLYKTISEWQNDLTFVPLKGEMCIAADASEQTVLAKVGDGVTTFGDLPWIQAIASDVYAWAKKSTLQWSDLSEEFKNSLSEYVGGEGGEYRIAKNGDVYKLQVRHSESEEWQDVADSTIDVSNKVDRQISGVNGKALIFNEDDGGGAKFEHTDGTWSFVGVNDGGADGIAGQIYAVNKDTKAGTRINITKNGMFYTKKSNASYDANDEIATKGDIAALGDALLYLGMTEKESTETIDAALARVVSDYQATHIGYTLSNGAVAIVDTKEFIYNGTSWQEFGDEGLYETKAEAQASHQELQDNIDIEAARRAAEDNKKTDKLIEENGNKALIFNEYDGGGAKFEHADGTWSFVGVNEGGKNGITGQIYSLDHNNNNTGTRLNMTNGGFFYTTNKASGAGYTAEDELATKGNINAAIGDLANIASTGNVNDLIQTNEDILILDGNG